MKLLFSCSLDRQYLEFHDRYFQNGHIYYDFTQGYVNLLHNIYHIFDDITQGNVNLLHNNFPNFCFSTPQYTFIKIRKVSQLLSAIEVIFRNKTLITNSHTKILKKCQKICQRKFNVFFSSSVLSSVIGLCDFFFERKSGNCSHSI